MVAPLVAGTRVMNESVLLDTCIAQLLANEDWREPTAFTHRADAMDRLDLYLVGAPPSDARDRAEHLIEAMEAIARESEHRIEGAADMWLSRQKDYGRLSVRFDMVAVLPRRWPVHVENAFQGRS